MNIIRYIYIYIYIWLALLFFHDTYINLVITVTLVGWSLSVVNAFLEKFT